jgi:hypothetical protein
LALPGLKLRPLVAIPTALATELNSPWWTLTLLQQFSLLRATWRQRQPLLPGRNSGRAECGAVCSRQTGCRAMGFRLQRRWCSEQLVRIAPLVKRLSRNTLTALIFSWGWGETGCTRYVGHYWPRMVDDDECEAVGGMGGSGEPKHSEKTCPSADLFTTNPTWPGLSSSSVGRGGKPATNRLSYGLQL